MGRSGGWSVAELLMTRKEQATEGEAHTFAASAICQDKDREIPRGPSE